jgi:hypothetical protein
MPRLSTMSALFETFKLLKIPYQDLRSSATFGGGREALGGSSGNLP